MRITAVFVLFLTFCLLVSCDKEEAFTIVDFNPIINYQTDSKGIKTLDMDYTYAIDSGFVIPSVNQTKDGMFHFSFKIENNTGISKKFYYKIYYQNETYKFPEILFGKEHPYAYENFYGSWENTDIEFKETAIIEDGSELLISDQFRIVGNPRNETKYIKADSIDIPLDPSEIQDYRKLMKKDSAWYASIVEKAKKVKVSADEQLNADAVYMTKEYRMKNIYNHRGMRNPRTGNYSFLIVVADEQGLNSLPDYIKNISKTSGNQYSNPYYYYVHLITDKSPHISSVLVNDVLKVAAKPSVANGLYVEYKYEKVDTGNFSCNCNNSFDLYKKAHFAQFLHLIDSSAKMRNISLVEDIVNSDYSESDYMTNAEKYDNKRFETSLLRTNQPCKTAWYDPDEKCLKIINPASTDKELKKENVGVFTRHGFTYGKYRAKVKLSEIINKNGIWNGLTNAIWMIYQDKQYNDRRICGVKGYIPRFQDALDTTRISQSRYSEIDFEIVKTSRFWPKTSYVPERNIPSQGSENKEDVIITCTNWDLACPEPKKFDVGAHIINYENNEFILHRWNHWYQALTLKTPVKDDEIFGSEFYYFEIEWKPEEIIWRIGPDPDNMRVVGYMNSDYTSIPNNQMIFVITQEFHLPQWWPEAPYKQDNIPFPAKDLTGKIYELVIE